MCVTIFAARYKIVICRHPDVQAIRYTSPKRPFASDWLVTKIITRRYGSCFTSMCGEVYLPTWNLLTYDVIRWPLLEYNYWCLKHVRRAAYELHRECWSWLLLMKLQTIFFSKFSFNWSHLWLLIVGHPTWSLGLTVNAATLVRQVRLFVILNKSKRRKLIKCNIKDNLRCIAAQDGKSK